MKKIKLMPAGKEVEVSDGQTVLAALEQQGYALPNNCRAGACGECKMKVLSGEFDQGFILDMALPQSDRDQGFGLMCMAKPTSDVLEIQWDNAEARPKLFPPNENLPYILTEKIEATPSIVKLRLKTLGESMRFWPGQYVTLGTSSIPARCYSIANIPNQDGDIILHVTKVDSGRCSSWVHDELSEGDTVNLSGPYGTFTGDPSAEKAVLCLAAGSGLAPIMSLSSGAMLRGGFKYPATVLFSARTKKDLYEVGQFKYLDQKFRNFKFKYTLTGEDNKDGLTGRIPDLLPSLYPDLSFFSIYIAGPTEFVDACVSVVKGLGAIDDQIHKEGFIDQSI
jgi:CDP-4-dehydro-6-deoxyglucose reductase, E3